MAPGDSSREFKFEMSSGCLCPQVTEKPQRAGVRHHPCYTPSQSIAAELWKMLPRAKEAEVSSDTGDADHVLLDSRSLWWLPEFPPLRISRGNNTEQEEGKSKTTQDCDRREHLNPDVLCAEKKNASPRCTPGPPQGEGRSRRKGTKGSPIRRAFFNRPSFGDQKWAT